MINLPIKLVFPMVFFMTSVNVLIWLTVNLYDSYPLMNYSVASIYSHLDIAIAVFLSLAYSRLRDPFAGVIGLISYLIIFDVSSGSLSLANVGTILNNGDVYSLNLMLPILAGVIVGVTFNFASRIGGVWSSSLASVISIIVSMAAGFILYEVYPLLSMAIATGTPILGSALSFLGTMLEHPLVSVPYLYLHRDFMDSVSGISMSTFSHSNSVSYIMVLGFTSGVLLTATVVNAVRGRVSLSIATGYMLFAGLLTGINDAFELILLVSAPLIYGVFVAVGVLFLFLVRLFDIESVIVFAPDAVHYIALRNIFVNEVMLLVLMGASAVLGAAIYFVLLTLTRYRFFGYCGQ